MSTAANVSAPRAATNPRRPQLSKRALNGLKTGASVELWFQCEVYTTEVNGVQKEENQRLLCSIHTALIRHFSGKCKRELAATDTTRVTLPFAREPTRLVAGWMLAGGGDKLGTPELPYPKNELRHLEILRNLATYLEIDSLVELITKDIATLTPVPPRLPATNSRPNPATKMAAPVGKRCWYCNQNGHLRRDCAERSAVHVTWSQGETVSMRATTPPAIPKVKPAVKPTARPNPADAPDRSEIYKITPISGQIRATDSGGWEYILDWTRVEMEVDLTRTPDGLCQVNIRGFASMFVPW